MSEPVFRDVYEAIAFARSAGVSGMVFNTWLGVFADTPEELEAANRDALALYDEMPEYLYPGAVIDPRMSELSLEWLRRFHRRGLRWVGELVPYRSKIDFDHPDWKRLFARCEEYGMIVQLHNSEGVIALAGQMPGLKIVCSHLTPEWLDALASHPNVFLDLSGVNGGLRPGLMERALTAFGAERLLWATDYTAFDPACFVARAERAFPDREVRRRIFSGNLRELLSAAGGIPMFVAPGE